MNNNFSLFENFLITDRSFISIPDLFINSILIIVLSFVLKKTYLKCANNNPNRKTFANNFLLLAFTTMIIIMVVKSSLALALGLVGALSIIRFRTAIKEPEELAYLFLNIAIGLGLGANQQIFTSIAFVIIIALIWFKYYFKKNKVEQNIFLTIKNGNLKNVKLDDITKIVTNNSIIVNIKRFEEDNNSFEITYSVGMPNYKNLKKCKNELLKLDDSISISFVDNNII